jgi:hypothetical protein
MFTKNVGRVDQILRIIIGVVFLTLVFVGPKTPWGYLGIVLIATAFINFCPIYSILGMKTNSKE